MPLIKVLLVDDLDENLLALEALLQRDGLECLKARSGEEALECLLVHDVALALLDVQMPGMNGFQLAEFMRGAERSRHVPIIFLTAGNADSMRRFRGYEAGAVDFIQKPIETDILRGKVNVFLDLYQQRRQIETQRDALEIQAAALRAANTHKSAFLAVLGHELRNPAAALKGGMYLMKRYRDEPEKLATVSDSMDRMIVHLSRLIEDLLDVSRIDQGRISIKKERVSLQDVIRFSIETSQPQIDAGRHTFTADIPSEPVWLLGDLARLSQAISNLLNNAAKYTPSGGQIKLTVRTRAMGVDIAIADNGIGIPLYMHDKIFELFAQVTRAAPKAADGLGVGLALVKQLVELHDGTITLTSDGEGHGSVFTVRLPKSE